MKSRTNICVRKEKKIYGREFHAVRDNSTILAFDIENVRIIELDDLELGVLNSIKKNPLSISEFKKRLPVRKGQKVEEAVAALLDVDMLGYSSFKKMSRKEIDDYERGCSENLKTKELKQIALNVTHKCNLHCDYCYGEDGSYGGPAVHMTRDTAEQAVDFLIKESGDSDTCRITFFGGEPLLNFDLVKYITQYARKKASKSNKKMYLGMTTNGVLLNEKIIDFLIKEDIEVTFSIDGPKEIHDMSRRFKVNPEKSSHDVIYPKILKYTKKVEGHDCYYGFRATITGPSIRNIDDLVAFFTSFKTKSIIYDTAEYNNGISPRGLAIRDDDLAIYRRKIKERAEKVRKNKLESGYNVFARPLKDMKDKIKKTHFCISPGALYVGVSAEGDIFPCHRLVGYKETKLGNVWDGFDREKWLKKYARVHIFNSKVCSRCWVRYFCGGMCPATNYFLGGDFMLSEKVEPEPVHCKLKKMIIEEAMLLFATLTKNDSNSKTKVEEQSHCLSC